MGILETIKQIQCQIKIIFEKLKDQAQEGIVSSISSPNNTISVVGTENIEIEVADSILNVINSAIQPGDNISELVDDIGYELLSNKGIANGYASLDSGSKIPVAQLPNSVMEYKGVYNASTNIPVLINGVGNTGDVYKVDVAGSGVNGLNFVVGDYAIYNGTVWEKSHSGADNITSVFGRVGIITAQNGDYDTSLIPETVNRNYQTDNQKLFNDATSSIQTQLNNKTPLTRTLNINGNSYDLTINREWRTAQADTGALTYGGITVASSTTVNIGAITGVIVNNETTPGTPIYTNVSYAGGTNITVPTITTGTGSYVLLNSSNALVFQNTFPTSAQRKSMIYLSKISHPNLSSISFAIDEIDFITSPLAQGRDWFQAIQYIKEGALIAGNAGLTINNTNGKITGDGINFVVDKTTPNSFILPAANPRNFLLLNQSGVAGGFVTAIDPLNYDVAGTTTLVGGSTNRSTIQYLYYAPGVGFAIQRGQTIYNTLLEAVAAVGRETFVVRANLVNNSILIAAICIRHTAVNMNDTSFVKILPADKFGQIGGASAGISVSNLQTAYNNSLVPQITTTTPLGAITFRNGKANDTLSVQEWQNIAGNTTASINGNGDIIGKSLTISNAPITSLTSFELLTRNTSTGLIEKISSSSKQNKLGWATPQDYGAIGDGVTDDTLAIQTCLTANPNVFLYGTYKVTNFLEIFSNQFIFSNNATITRVSTNSAILAATEKNNIQIKGMLTLVGAGNAIGTASGISLSGCDNVKIDGVIVKDMTGYGFNFETGSATTARGDGALVSNIQFINCWIGLRTFIGAGGEYHSFSNLNATLCNTGVMILGGNITLTGGNIVDNTTGLYLGGNYGQNNSHGIINGVNINHNSNLNLYIQNAELGESIMGCHFYGTSTNNIKIEDSKGIVFSGCIIDGRLQNTDSQVVKGAHVISNSQLGPSFTPDVNGINYKGNFSLSDGNVRSSVYDNGGNVGIKTVTPVGACNIFTGLTGASIDILGQQNGSISFANLGSSSSIPSIVGKSNDGTALYLMGINNDINPNSDCTFNTRPSSGDFSIFTTSAFRFTRFSTTLIDILRNGNTGLGITPTAKLHIAASTTLAAAMRLTVGVAPTTPNDGDIWLESNTNTGLKIRIAGVTKTISLV